MKGFRETHYEENGKDCILVDGIYVFSNGASMDRHRMGALWDPPTDRRELLKMQALYREEKLRLATDAFNALKHNLMVHAKESIKWAGANTPPIPPTESELAELKSLQAEVHKWQAEVKQLHEQLQDAKPDYMKQRERRAIENADRNAAALAAVDAIKI